MQGKALRPHRPQAVSTASKHTGSARVGGFAAGPAACPRHQPRPFAPSPAPAPSQALPLRCPLPKAKTCPPCTPPAPAPPTPSPSAVLSQKQNPPPTGRRPFRLRRNTRASPVSAAPPPGLRPALCTPRAPSNPFPPTQSLPIRPRFSPCPHPIAPNFTQYCKFSVNTLRTYVLFRCHMLQ